MVSRGCSRLLLTCFRRRVFETCHSFGTGSQLRKGNLLETNKGQNRLHLPAWNKRRTMRLNQRWLLFKTVARVVEMPLVLTWLGWGTLVKEETIKEHGVSNQQALLNNICFQDVFCQYMSSSIRVVLVIQVSIGIVVVAGIVKSVEQRLLASLPQWDLALSSSELRNQTDACCNSDTIRFSCRQGHE